VNAKLRDDDALYIYSSFHNVCMCVVFNVLCCVAFTPNIFMLTYILAIST